MNSDRVDDYFLCEEWSVSSAVLPAEERLSATPATTAIAIIPAMRQSLVFILIPYHTWRELAMTTLTAFLLDP